MKTKTVLKTVEVEVPDGAEYACDLLDKEIDYFETTGNDPVAVEWLKYAKEIIECEVRE
jgi:hypothetical protein